MKNGGRTERGIDSDDPQTGISTYAFLEQVGVEAAMPIRHRAHPVIRSGMDGLCRAQCMVRVEHRGAD